MWAMAVAHEIQFPKEGDEVVIIQFSATNEKVNASHTIGILRTPGPNQGSRHTNLDKREAFSPFR